MRYKIFRVLISVGLVVLAAGLFNTQILNSKRYRNISEKNRLRLIPLEAPRGRVFDREGKLLVTNRASYNVVASSDDITHQALQRLAKVLNLSVKEVQSRLQNNREYRYAPSM